MKLKAFQESFSEILSTQCSSTSKVVSAILPVGNLSKEDCIDVYKEDYIARLTEALGSTCKSSAHLGQPCSFMS